MIITYILIVFFYTSLAVVLFILARGIFNVDKNSLVTYDNDVHYIIFSHIKKISKRTLRESFKISKSLLIFTIVKMRPVVMNVRKSFLSYYKDFFDSVNGKNGMKEKGASSFFLKTIAQYKKEIKKSK